MSGCGPDHRTEFVQIADDNEKITAETCDSLILSIREEMDNVAGENRVELENLIERLEYMKSASAVIHRYAKTHMMDLDVFADLIRLRLKILKEGSDELPG